jgi:HD-GYP domain-containing protein (c-di-GMP phosphodiesterase class II)
LAVRASDELLQGLVGSSIFTTFLDAEPAPRTQMRASRLREVAAAFGAFADVKSPYTTGHSQHVATLARAAAGAMGLAPGATGALEVAALLHDVGRVAISNGVWDKATPLTPIEWGQVHAHTFETDRILRRSMLLAPAAALASRAHERIDGEGYHRGLSGSAITAQARVLAAADVYAALGEPRPHRPAYHWTKAADVLAQEARLGRLGAEAVDAVLQGAGIVRGRRALVPDALSAREIDVVRLLVRGLANKEIGSALGISSATVKRHMENVFDKIGSRTRAAVAVWAVENQVLDSGDTPTGSG